MWTSFVCSTRHFTTQTTTQCLKDKHIYMMGDSTMRQWFDFFVKALPSEKRADYWLIICYNYMLLIWLSTEAVAFFSLSRPPLFSSLLASSVSSHIYWRDSLCTALQTGKLWIWSTGLSAQLIPSSQGEVWVLGNPFVPTGRSRPDIRGMHGRGGKSYVWRLFPWGRWGYLPFRHHDNRYSADWIRLCPGLSENSEDGNSCPKSHKAARFDWSRGKSGQQWDWDYKPEYGCHHVETYGFASENWWFQRPEWTERIKLWKVCSCSPQKTQQNLILSFLAPPYRLAWPRSCRINYTGRALQWRLSCSLPPLQTLLPSPINCLWTLCTATCRAGLRPAS